jgi:hypothetical protein
VSSFDPRSFEIAHRRAQDASRGRLHEAATAGLIDGFAHAYLGMAEDRLPNPLCDLMPADSVRNYPTSFGNPGLHLARRASISTWLAPLW